MKILYKDLVKHLSEKPSKESLSEKLFQLGHEHEIQDDIFDMEFTPNRGDCLSLLGLARDLNVFYGKSDVIGIFERNIDALEIDFENLSPLDCPKITFLEIEIEEITDSYQHYLDNYIATIGNKRTNLFTDISNYVSYELGQPTHCFDRDTINNKLIFENRECNNNFKTLLGSEIMLQDRNCVFTLDDEIISLAGVIGGASTACSTETRRVLVECAYFNPEAIIGKSIKYNLSSEAAHKFERGVDIASQELALRRFAKIVEDHATIKSIRLKSFFENEFKTTSIPINVNKINKILGTSIDDDKCLGYLEDLGFNISDQINVPSFRHDIKTNNDLAEEVARVIGYNNINSSSINLGILNNDKKDDKVAKLESFLIKNGFYEVINFPFTQNKQKESINIDNPLDSNRNNFRISLKDSLIENLLYNERRQKDSIKIFEISDIYTKDTAIKQKKKLGLIVSGRQGNNFNDFSKKLDYKYLNKLLNIDHDDDIFEITEIARSNLDTKKKDKIYYVETALEDIPISFFSRLENHKRKTNFITYKPISEYPSSSRDFSFLIEDLQVFYKVINLLDGISDTLIKDSFMFDYYKDDKRKIIKLGYRFVFQSHLKTLSDTEINKKVNEILSPILEIDKVSIPGM